MSQTKAQLVSPVGILTGTGINVSGVITAASFVGDGSGLINVAGGGGGGGSLIVKDSGALAGTIGTIDFGSNISVSNALVGIVTVSATNTTYSQSASASGDNVNLRLSGTDSSTDDILVSAGDNITITSVTSNGFTINSTSVEATKVLTIGVRTGAAVSFGLPSSTFNVIGRSGSNIPITV